MLVPCYEVTLFHIPPMNLCRKQDTGMYAVANFIAKCPHSENTKPNCIFFRLLVLQILLRFYPLYYLTFVGKCFIHKLYQT
jgi:hypothetical protein